MEKNYFLNEEGHTCYKLECGCEGTKIPGFGWHNILCDEHEYEQEMMLCEPTHFKKIRKFKDNQSI